MQAKYYSQNDKLQSAVKLKTLILRWPFFAKGQGPLYFVSSDLFFCESMTYLVLALSGKRPGQTVNKCWLFAECGKKPKKSRFEEVLTTNENKLPLQYPYSFFKSDVFVFSRSYLIYTSRKKASFFFYPFLWCFLCFKKRVFTK